MRRGTTPTLTIDVDDETFQNCTVYLTLKQDSNEVTIRNPDVLLRDEGCRIVASLTQEQTLALRPGWCKVQIRWIDSDGYADAKDIYKIPVKDVLNDEVIKYED